MTEANRIKEIQAIRALAAELLKRTSLLEEGNAPVSGRSPRKGSEMSLEDKASLRRRKFIAKKMGR